jgi:hypothetical protein
MVGENGLLEPVWPGLVVEQNDLPWFRLRPAGPDLAYQRLNPRSGSATNPCATPAASR